MYILNSHRKLVSKFNVHSIIFEILMAQNNFRMELVTKNRTGVILLPPLFFYFLLGGVAS